MKTRVNTDYSVFWEAKLSLLVNYIGSQKVLKRKDTHGLLITMDLSPELYYSVCIMYSLLYITILCKNDLELSKL